MADNVTITPGSGVNIAADDLGGGVMAQRVKPVCGDDGVGLDVSYTNPMPVVPTDLSFIQRIAIKALSKLTFSLTGLRCDISGQNLGTVTTVTTVTTVSTLTSVSACNGVAMGRATQDGQGIQASYWAFQQGFRRNLSVS